VETRTGTLEIIGRESRLNGVLLAKCDAPDDPIQAATGFLKDIPLASGDFIWVTGEDGHVGNTHVFCITAAGKSAALRMVAAAKPVAKKATPTAAKKTAKPTKKKAAKRKPQKATKGRSKGLRK
jgi:hypothetical protein